DNYISIAYYHVIFLAFALAFKPKQLEEINQETLILWGDQDKILGIKDAPKFARAIPHSKLIWIKDSGHVPHLEQPQITATEILDFS
ncbi:MAG: alpha/beta hydrolase, partial [Rivularia sp. T60_A2020_040]|nr:alpha/beta hydrolase [Rivularia sp. T60_A2020_040]